MSCRFWIFSYFLGFSTISFAGITQSGAILYGTSKIVGDLDPSDSRNPVSTYRYLLQTDSPNSWGVGIHVISSSLSAATSEFPFEEKESVAVLSFLFVPTICTGSNYQICSGIGQGTVNTNSKKQRRDYGSWNYHIHGHVPIGNSINLEGQFSYVGKVEIETEEGASEFSLIASSLGASYLF